MRSVRRVSGLVHTAFGEATRCGSSINLYAPFSRSMNGQGFMQRTRPEYEARGPGRLAGWQRARGRQQAELQGATDDAHCIPPD
jgi:hypothetical protein